MRFLIRLFTQTLVASCFVAGLLPVAADETLARLDAPEIVRVRLGSLERSAVIGATDAPITIVAFLDYLDYLDYQYPYCASAHSTLQKVTESYGDRVHIVFKHNPLSLHKEAELAAQAALVAMVLGEFEPMHGLLLERQKNLSRGELTELAVATGIDRDSFDEVLDSGDFAADVRRDVNLAKKIGVTSTPFFFVNGRPFRGAQPFSAFQAVIDQEIAGTAGTTRWVEKLERPAPRDRQAPEAKNFDRTRSFLEGIARAKSPEAANTLLLSHIAQMDRELQALREEVRELRKTLGSFAGAQRERRDLTARAQTARDRIVTVGDVPLGNNPAQGSKDAKIGIVAFGDFACPYTRKFSRYVLPTIRERYVDGGRVRYIFRDRPLDYNPRSREAAIAANCTGDQGAYWEMYDAMFVLDGTLEDVDFAAMAERLGLKVDDFLECSADPERLKEIEDDIEEAEISRLGLRVVPTLLIGRIEGDKLVGAKRVSGVQSVRVLGAVIESLLAN